MQNTHIAKTHLEYYCDFLELYCTCTFLDIKHFRAHYILFCITHQGVFISKNVLVHSFCIANYLFSHQCISFSYITLHFICCMGTLLMCLYCCYIKNICYPCIFILISLCDPSKYITLFLLCIILKRLYNFLHQKYLLSMHFLFKISVCSFKIYYIIFTMHHFKAFV